LSFIIRVSANLGYSYGNVLADDIELGPSNPHSVNPYGYRVATGVTRVDDGPYFEVEQVPNRESGSHNIHA
jgi:hypothetical protein